MNTKKATEVKDLILFMERTKLKSKGIYPKEVDEVINLLKCGEKLKVENIELEKYEKMWNKSKKDLSRASVLNWEVSLKQIILEINKLEQKYFPDTKEEVIK